MTILTQNEMKPLYCAKLYSSALAATSRKHEIIARQFLVKFRVIH